MNLPCLILVAAFLGGCSVQSTVIRYRPAMSMDEIVITPAEEASDVRIQGEN